MADGDGVIVVPLEIADGVATYAHQERTNDRIGRGRLYQALGWAPDETVDTPDPVDAGSRSLTAPAHRLSRATPEPLGVPVPRAWLAGLFLVTIGPMTQASAYLSFTHYNILSPPSGSGSTTSSSSPPIRAS